MTFNCKCTRCGGTGEGVTAQQAKFTCHHKVGCGRKIGILEWTNSAPTVSTTSSTETVTIEAPVETPAKEKPKKKKKKKVEE